MQSNGRESSRIGNACAPLKPGERLTARDAGRAATLFRVLSGETRLRLLHSLSQAGERNVGDLASDIGVSVQAVSNQLARMVELGVVQTRRDGVRIFYRIVDPCIRTLLENGLCLARTIGRGKVESAGKTGAHALTPQRIKSAVHDGMEMTDQTFQNRRSR